jgi:DNA-binding NtrC family response regulator/pSer/pThr/pTyr-binding forkhead associated (FHA) protein
MTLDAARIPPTQVIAPPTIALIGISLSFRSLFCVRCDAVQRRYCNSGANPGLARVPFDFNALRLFANKCGREFLPARSCNCRQRALYACRIPVEENETTLRHDPAGPGGLNLVAVGNGEAKTFPVVEGAELVIGRGYPSDVIFKDASISRTHAKLRIQDGALEITDLQSTNGVWIAGRCVREGKVPAGEPLRIGNVTLMLQSSPSRVHGMDDYDEIAHWLEREIARAQSFGRPLALMSLAYPSTKTTSATLQVPVWQRLNTSLRDVDRMGMYAPWEVLVGMPETTRAEALSIGASVAKGTDLRVAVAQFPEDGRTLDELLAAVHKPRAARETVEAPARPAAIDSPAMQRVRQELQRIAASKLPVLLIGETGVGKELMAKQVHLQSPRSTQPFVAFNCASVPQTLLESVLFGHEKGAFTGADRTTRGVFEQASGGTLFLDEVGELSQALQAALLRVLETSTFRRVGSERDLTVDVRIVAATHRDLEALGQQGTFRPDLLFRLEGALIRVPPLRERREEILPLAQAFLYDACIDNGFGQKHLTKASQDALLRHTWPGNVRELKNAIFRAAVVATTDQVDPRDLPHRVTAAAPISASLTPGSSPSPSLPPPMLAVPTLPEAEASDGEQLSYKDKVRAQVDRYEYDLIAAALSKHGGNQTAAAHDLKIPVRTLAHKMKELGIKSKA